MIIRVDQSQYTGGATAGWGQTAAVRYRGMGFTPTMNYIVGITFQRNKGSQGIKIYIDSADTDSIPTHAEGAELYSWVVPNGQIISGAFQRYMLPTPLAVTPGNQYCFYVAPWGSAYADDYQDGQWTNTNVYSGGKPIVNNAGTWSVSDSGNLDMKFEIWGTNEISSNYINSFRRAYTSDGIGLSDSFT